MDPLLLRFLERLTIVLFSGMAIYLGFRLFLEVPEHRNASGAVKLPWDTSIVLTRIGPGAFFALFGVVALSVALLQPLKIEPQGKTENAYYYAGSSALNDPTARADARSLLRKEMNALNTIPSLLRADLAQIDKDDVTRTIRQAKLRIMEPVWGEAKEGFGEFSEFEHWVLADEPDPPPAGMEGALALYRYGLK